MKKTLAIFAFTMLGAAGTVWYFSDRPINAQTGLTQVTLTSNAVYINEFRNNSTGAIVTATTTKTLFDMPRTIPNYALPQMSGYTWIRSYNPPLFSTGKTTLDDNQYYDAGNYYVLKLPSLPLQAIKKDRIVGGNLTATSTP